MTIHKKTESSGKKGEILLRGLGASKGKVTGSVKVIRSSSDLENVVEGQVIVTYMTNPKMTTALMKAGALVTDVGGILCHAAIIARELGIPCVVDTKEGTNRLKDGMKVTVDGFEGFVYSSDCRGTFARRLPARG